MQLRSIPILILLLVHGALRAGVTLNSGTDPLGNACDVVSWTDSVGSTRTVWIKNANPGAFITRYTWYAGATLVDSRVRENYPPWGFMTLVNHWHPDSTGNFVASCNSADITSPLVKSVVFQGPNHLIWRGTFRMRMDPTNVVPGSWYNTVEYTFSAGRDDFVFSCAYDSSDVAQANLWSDMRGPYGDFDFDGDASANEVISGIGWGSTYKFRTTGSTLSQSSAWDYTQPNSVPYIWQWKDATLNDRELGIVQNQPYAVQAGSMELHVGNCALAGAWGTANAGMPPTSGTGLPTNMGCVGYQLNSYGVAGTLYKGQRFTWGTVWRNAWGLFGNGKGVFEEGHQDAFALYTYNNQYPVNAWSWNVLLGRYSDGGTTSLVNDTQAAYSCTLTASVGSVVSSGPRGPGNYVAPATGSMPTITYSKAGFDFVYRAWTLQASGGDVTASLAVAAAGLKRPAFIIKGLSSAPCAVKLDGATQVEGVDIFSSYDSSGQRLFITFNKNLATGARQVQVLSACGSPTPTSTPSVSPTRTAVTTPTTSPTATRSFTRTPLTTPTVSSTPTPSPTPGSPSCATDGPLLLTNDKILFFGDSITYRGNYSKAVQDYLTGRYPASNFSFVNAGVPGDTAQTGSFRLAPVIAQAPNVVLVCFGMNDAIGASYMTDFPTYMTTIITSLQAQGYRVALLTPGWVDMSAPGASAILPANMNTRLRWEADWVLSYAASNSLPVYDIHADMSAANAGALGALTGWNMIPDGIHPDPAGGLLMALGALKALGVPDRCGDIVYSAAPSVSASGGPTALGAAAAAGAYTFDLNLHALPFVPLEAARKVLPWSTRFGQINHLGLQASGLPAGNYYVSIDGHIGGTVTAAALATGLNLFDYWRQGSIDPEQVHQVALLSTASTPAPGCDGGLTDGLIDDFEDNDLVNRWGGDLWGLDLGTGASTAAPSPLTPSAGGYSSAKCMRISGNADLTANPPALVCYVNGLYSDVKDGVRFWFKGSAGKQVRFQIHTWYEKLQLPEYWNDYGYLFTGTGAWQQVQIPYSSLVLPGWGTPYTFNKQEAYDLVWFPMTTGAYDISIDQVEFYCVAPVGSPTVTRTSTLTRTASPSPSPTPTRSWTASNTSSPSASPSPSLTPSRSASPSVTASFSPSPVFSPSVSPSATVSYTVSPTRSASPTASATRTPSATPSDSPSVTVSPTASPVYSATASPTVSPTTTRSVTGTVSRTTTPSASPSPTRTNSVFPSQSPTRTASPSATPTLTLTPVASPSPSVTSAAVSAPGRGPLEARSVIPAPNPNPAAFMVDLAGPASKVQVYVYTQNLARVAELEGPGSLGAGWVRVDAGALNLPNGTYYLAAYAEQGGQRSQRSSLGRFVFIR